MELLTFDTDRFQPDARHAAFAQTLVNLRLDPVGDSSDFAAKVSALPLKPIILYRNEFSAVRYVRDANLAIRDAHDHFSLTILLADEARGEIGGREIVCAAGDALFADHSEPMDIHVPGPAASLVILIPRAFLQEVLPQISGSQLIGSCLALRLIEGAMDLCFAQAAEIQPGAAASYARSFRGMIAAAIQDAGQTMPTASSAPFSLLRRAIGHIDRHVAAPLAPDGIASALGVSRSALYRATKQSGGVAKLIRRRRLHAISRMLSDPNETRPISAIASRCGYNDMSHFSRDFRKMYGLPAGMVRAGACAERPLPSSLQQRFRALLIDLAGDEPPVG